MNSCTVPSSGREEHSIKTKGSTVSIDFLPGTSICVYGPGSFACFMPQDTKPGDTTIWLLTLHTHYAFRNIAVISLFASPRVWTSSKTGLINSVIIQKLCQNHILEMEILLKLGTRSGLRCSPGFQRSCLSLVPIPWWTLAIFTVGLKPSVQGYLARRSRRFVQGLAHHMR